MTHPNIHLAVDDDVARLVIDRPERKNACTRLMWEAIAEAAREIASAPPRVTVITGTGGDFCSGADMSRDPDETDTRKDHGLITMRGIGDAVTAVHDLPMPVIAAVDGVAVGAGFGLALSADLTYCTDRARFSAIFAKRGLSLDFGTSWLLVQRIGLHRAKELTFTAEIVGAEAAADLGLVNGVVGVEELDTKVQEMVDTIVAGPPLALSMSKRLLDNAASAGFAQALEAESLAQNVNFTSEDTIEAMKAFAERRTPEFRGR